MLINQIHSSQIHWPPQAGYGQRSVLTKVPLMAFKDKILHITPQQLSISAAFGDTKSSSEHTDMTLPMLADLLVKIICLDEKVKKILLLQLFL